ncbi:TIGR01212 family radical SAM protein [Lagierella sp.]|uniref:TIGR01212 family radical SAM protein n=1 Tax=Lagierella sp. TaxID=2849657 RepID=UPI00262711EA|nr:TIGR01212 family radical SAM protein [Lagierella sp.]
MNSTPYYVYSDYLKEKYGEKVYKLPIKLNLTCPNRDGRVARGGCIFCSESGGSFENLSSSLTVENQLKSNMEYIGKRYNAKLFIAYFQNFSNTYMSLEDFKSIIESCKMDNIVGISISTRPDCVYQSHLEFLKEFAKDSGLEIIFELGLQTANYHTLNILNRGHGIAEFVDSCIRIKESGFRICSHVIIGLPWDEDLDIVETGKMLNVLKVDEVKIHSLYIPKGTKLSKMYKNDEFELISREDYERKVILFLRHLNPRIVIQRLIGRMPKEETVFCNWQTSWWKIKESIEDQMLTNGYKQGDLYRALEENPFK